ncbi:MAG TPA: hypothetical protein VH877_04735 [Polyangia bacterium]|jgi:hypothetical protein|nr:hypothetical protein [Polyangia bacterium]
MRPMRWLFGQALLLSVAGCSGGSDPNELARERGAVELLTAWRCQGGASHLRDVTGGDLKTDWTAARQADGSYRVTLRRGGQVDTWRVRPGEQTVTPESEGARAAWQKCTGASAR